MAALGFVAGPDSFKRIGSVGLPAGFLNGSSSSSNGFAMNGSSSSSIASEFAGVLLQQQMQPQPPQQSGLGAGFGAAVRPLHFQAPPGAAASGAAGSWGVGPLTAGQLVTGLVAAPLLAVLTPLAVLSELQRRQQQR